MRFLIIFITLICVLIFETKTVEEEDYYQILGINRYGAFRDIRKAYKKLALITHPDKNKSNDTLETFLLITKAYEVLKDPESRKKYDLLGVKAPTFTSNSAWRKEYQDFSYFTKTFGYFDEDTDIVVLTEGDFDGYVKYNDGVWFVFFYNPYCEKCHSFKEIWRRVAAALDGVVHVAAVNCKEDFSLCSRLGYIHVPKFVLFKNNTENVLPMSHDSRKTEEDLINFTMNYIDIPLHTISSKMWRNGMQTQWVLALCLRDSTQNGILHGLAVILENIVSVGEITDRTLCEEIYKNYESSPIIFWTNKTYTGQPVYSVKPVVWSTSRGMADTILKDLPDAKTLDLQDILDIQKEAELGTKDVWLIHFHFSNVLDVSLELKRLPAMLPNIKIGTMNCRGVSNYCAALNIGDYPQWGVIGQTGNLDLHYGCETIQEVAAFVRDSIKGLHIKFITDQDYNNVINSGESWLIIWTSSWCAKCRDLLSSLRRSSDYFLSKNISLGIIECGLRKNLCIENEIRNYPTIRFHKKWQVYNFFGPYNTKSVIEFIKDMLNPRVLYLTADVFHKDIVMKSMQQTYVVLYYTASAPSCYPLHNEWRKLAKELSFYQNINVAEVDCGNQQCICSQQKINFYPIVYVYPSGYYGLDTYDVYKGEHRVEDLLRWLRPFLSSPVQHIFLQDLTELVRSFTSFLVLFYNGFSDEFTSLAKEFFHIAENNLLPFQMNFRILNCESDLNICNGQGVNQYPEIILYDYGTRHLITRNTAADIAEQVKLFIYLPHDEL